MYNESVKTAFIRDFTDSIRYANEVVRVFEQIEKREEEANKDFACFTEDEARDCCSELARVRSTTAMRKTVILRAYIRWCASNRIDGANKELLDWKWITISLDKTKMVKNPAHLETVLNSIFDPVEEYSIDNIYRLYFWGIYSGMGTEQISSCTAGNVDLWHMTFRVDGEEFPIYRESVNCICTCAELKEFKEKHPNSTSVRDMRPRCSGAELSRGFVERKNPKGLAVVSIKHAKEAYDSGKTNVLLTFNGLTMSGLFYRMYERESAGFPVDFSSVAQKDMEGKEYHLKTLKEKYLKQRKTKEYEDDYLRWKIAFGLA